MFNPKPSSALDFCLQTRAKIIGGGIFGRKSSSVLLSVSHPLSLSKKQSSFVSSPLYSLLLSRSLCTWLHEHTRRLQNTWRGKDEKASHQADRAIFSKGTMIISMCKRKHCAEGLRKNQKTRDEIVYSSRDKLSQ